MPESLSYFNLFIVYACVWCIMLFMVLPIAALPSDTPETGHDRGAPARPRIGMKLLLTTALAIPGTAIVMWVLSTGLIPLREGWE